MKKQSLQIGFSQRVRLEWLDKTANLVLAGNTRKTIESALQELLKEKVSVGGDAERGNREKIISILLRVWLSVPQRLEPLRQDGLDLLRGLPPGNRIAVHWGMVMAAYPFWGMVANQVGRLLRLQCTAAAAHIQRRLREQYGERETVARATRRVLRSFLDWRVLTTTKVQGVYRQSPAIPLHAPKLIAWLMEASLHARPNGSADLRDLLGQASLFPFRLTSLSAPNLVAASPRMELLRHGLDHDLIVLRR